MEKRSHRRIRDLVAHTAFKGLDANEIGCVRISIMARSKSLRSKGRIQMSETSHLQISHIQLATHGRSIQKCQSRTCWRLNEAVAATWWSDRTAPTYMARTLATFAPAIEVTSLAPTPNRPRIAGHPFADASVPVSGSSAGRPRG